MNVYSVTSETGMQIFVGIIIIGPSPGTTRVFAMVLYLAFVSRPGNQWRNKGARDGWTH